MDDIPPDIQHDELLDGASYAERLEYFRDKLENVSGSSDIFLLVGHGCGLKVKNDALMLQQGSAHGETVKPVLLYRGTHRIKQIVFLSTSGFVTIDALHWCRSQDISILMLDELGNLIYALSPENEFSARLRRIQYRASDTTDLALSIVRDLIRMKTVSQIDMLKTLAKYKHKRAFEEYRLGRIWSEPNWKALETGLAELDLMTNIRMVLLHEARLAMIYWGEFIGVPIKWQSKDAKIVPPHWKRVTERFSSSSSGNTARRATNPFHAALNYMYAVTEHQLLCAIHVEGLDPACGFLHADSDNRLSLVYDLIEPLRAVVDGRVFSFFNRETFSRGDFTPTNDGGIMFNPELLRFLVASCKLDDSISGGMVSWFKESLLSLSAQY